ncbi:MAG: phosphoesterase, partial [Dehalococcoidia bacterium]
LGKNDTDANWFQFLWGKRFRWSPPADTPVRTGGDLASAAYQGVLYVVYEDDDGDLYFRTFDGKTWYGEQPVGQKGSDKLSLATCGNELFLLHETTDGTLSALNHNLETGWSQSPQQIVSEAIGHFAMTAYDQDDNLMLADQWRILKTLR